jgi:hypothetical protein
LPAGILALTVPAMALGHLAQALPPGWCAAGGLSLAGLTWAVTRRNRRGVAAVVPVADIAAIAAGHRGVSERPVSAVEAA